MKFISEQKFLAKKMLMNSVELFAELFIRFIIYFSFTLMFVVHYLSRKNNQEKLAVTMFTLQFIVPLLDQCHRLDNISKHSANYGS